MTSTLLSYLKPPGLALRPWLLGTGRPGARSRCWQPGGKPHSTKHAWARSAPAPRATATSAPPTRTGAVPAENSSSVAERAAAAEEESLELLEWPALCRQVACFTQTAIGAELALDCRLPVGRTQEESERLLQETHEAQQAALVLKGVFDIRRALDASQAGLVLHPLVLGAIGLTLEAAQQVDAALQSGGSFPALLQLADGLRGGVPEVQAALFQCIQVEDGRILDAASERLAATRTERKRNMQELRKKLDEWARLLHSKGVSERPQVVMRRGRLCIPVRLGRQGELPKGSLTLATSASGSTLYVEPEPVVALNNAEMALAGEEEEEEQRVLAALSQLVGTHARAIQRLLDAITALDLATARGRHATWLGASRPALISSAKAEAAGAVCIPRAWHPLLLQPCLPPLPAPPLVDVPPSSTGASSAGSGDSEDEGSALASGLGLVPELLGDTSDPLGASARAGGSRPASGAGANDSSSSSSSSNGGGAAHPLPVPTQLTVPPGVRVVAVTGPNTGGKTASLKALGLLSLMAKAGCFLPQAPAAGPDSGSGSSSSSSSGEAPQLVWFDKVLADLGDGQSLQQSLSTFSGHVRRIRNILAAATPRSLVLMDEVGSGTDPSEGAALAAALLERLHGGTALTYATTHHAELKELASIAPGFVNANVEFDIATLRPTYRLRWGASGESNALAISEGLGFDHRVVARAREVAAQLHAAKDASQRAELLQSSLDDQLAEAQRHAEAAAASRRAAEEGLAAAEAQLAELQQEAATLGKGRGAQEAKLQEGAAKDQLAQALAAVRTGKLSVAEAEEAVRKVEAAAAAANKAAMSLVGIRAAAEAGVEWEGQDGGSSSRPGEGGLPARSSAAGGWVPRQGEAVRVLKMGGAPGTVLVAPRGGGGDRKVGVRVGALTLEMQLSDLAPMGGAASNGAGGGGVQQQQQQQRRGVQRRSSGKATAGGGSSGGGKGPAATAKERLRAEGVLASGDKGGGSGEVLVTLQTARNTVDVRGQTSEDAVSEVETALGMASPGSVLYVVTGLGTGRVRAAVQAALKRSRWVQRFEEQAESLGGCTVVYTR